jgi:signal transduction histidine kinase/ActR/RegA family two-component response regulator
MEVNEAIPLSLRRPFFLLILAAFLPLLMLSAALGVAALRQEQAAIEIEAMERVRSLAAAIGRDLTAQLDVLRVVAQSRDFDHAVSQDEFMETARRLKQEMPAWRALRLTDPDAKVAADAPIAANEQGISQGQVVDLESHQRAVESKQPVIGKVLRGPRGRHAFALRAPVIRDGQVRYIISAVVEPDSIRDQFLTPGLPDEWVATAIDGDGNVAARTTGPADLIGTPASAAARAARDSGKEEGIYEGFTLDGIATMSVYRMLPIGQWSVHVGVPRDIFTAPVRRSLWLLGAGLTATLLLAGVFLWLLARELGLRRHEEANVENVRRLEALGRMTGGVAHDFNNLLMIVQGSAEAIKRRVADPEKQQSYADAILTAVQRGQALTRQLLAFARRGRHEPVSFRIQQRTGELGGLLSRSVRDNVQVVLSVPDTVWPIKADPNALEVALINLAVNASDAMPNGGRLVVNAVNVSLRKGRDNHTGLQGDFVAIAVKDTGTGIAAEHLVRIFEPFYTTKPTGKGTGLGLSQVYGFAQQSGGSVTVSSRINEGSTFTLFLPRSADAVASPSSLPAAATVEADEVGGRVLVVEDNNEVAEATAAMLTDAGYRVTRAASAWAAFDLLGKGEAFDVILSDIVMEGGMSGLELAQRVLKENPSQPIVLMTGYSEALSSADLKNVSVLLKPFSQQEVRAALAAARKRQAPALDTKPAR